MNDAPSYYDALAASADTPARRAGWEHALGQAARFEAALAPVVAGDLVLDVGCGLADLAPYLAAVRPGARYVGLDALPSMVAAARARHPAADVRLADALADGPLPEADVVVAVGALVSGAPLTDDASRFARARDLARACLAAARRCAVLVALDQDALEARAALAAEPALGGLRAAEAPWVAHHLGAEHAVARVLSTDLALVLWRPGSPRPALPSALVDRVLAGPAGRDAGPLDVAWLRYAAGDLDRAADALERAADGPRRRWLADAIAAARPTGR